MKKIFTLTLMLLGIALSSSAQDRKTWDFTKGWSDETLENLKSGKGAQVWNCTWKDDGSLSSAQENGKYGSGNFTANDVPIKELTGLTRSSAGLSKNNNYLLTATTFRLNRNNQELFFPDLKNGQTLTVVGRSANSTAEDRGVKGKYDYMKLIEGPEDCLVKASLGTVTLKWRIETESTDAVPVAIQMIKGGVDFTLFMIDEGDIIPVTKTAYLYNGEPSAAAAALQARENTEVDLIDVASATVTAEQLQGYVLTVIDPSVPADNAAVQVVKETMPFTPVLNMNALLYPAWGYGTAVAITDGVSVAKNTKSNLLKGIELQDDGEGNKMVPITEGSIYGVTLGDYFKGDEIVLGQYMVEEGGEPAVIAHMHNITHNGYIYMPWGEVTPQLFENAVALLADSKQEITGAAKPVITQVYKDLFTLVNVAAGSATQPKTKIFYTTDGTEPTEASTLYEGPVTIDKACTFKAVAIAEGYTLSEPASAEIAIYSQPKSPVIAAEYGEGKTTVTLTCESEGVDLWYNLESTPTNDTLKSTKYTEPFTITAPQTVNAFSVAGGTIFSEITSERHAVKDARVVIDVAAHFNATFSGKSNGGSMFSYSKNGQSGFVGEVPVISGVDPETGDETEVPDYSQATPAEYSVVYEDGENPAWAVCANGEGVVWESNTPSNVNFGDDAGYNPTSPEDVDPLFPASKNNISFYKVVDVPNAFVVTTAKYQAPLDVVVLAGMPGGEIEVQVSADSIQWTTVGDRIVKNGYVRMWKKYTRSYNGTDEVYVRVIHVKKTSELDKARIFDIYIANAGEKSAEKKAEYDAEYAAIATGIKTVQPTAQRQQAVFNLNGVRQQRMQRGLNIVVMPDGTVRKVVIK